MMECKQKLLDYDGDTCKTVNHPSKDYGMFPVFKFSLTGLLFLLILACIQAGPGMEKVLSK